MSDSWKKVIADARKGKVCNSYLLYGEEEFRVEAALKALMDELVPVDDKALNLVVTDGAEVTWEEVLSDLRTTSMFGGRKVVVVRDARLGAGPKEAFKKAREAWNEGVESKKRRAALIMMGILGDLDWPLEALSDGGPEAHGTEIWDKEAKIKLDKSDFDWMSGLFDYAREMGMSPSKSDKTEKLEEFIRKADSSGAVLILSARSANKTTSLYKTIAASGVTVGFEAPRGDFKRRASLKSEIDRVLVGAGKKMDGRAMQRLELKTGFDLRRALGEIEKLIIFVGDSKIIRAEDVEAVVPRTKEESIFELTDAFARRDVSNSLRLVDELEEAGHHPLEMLGIIHSQVRNLYIATQYARDLSGRKIWNKRMNYGEFQKRAWSAIKEAEEKRKEALKEKNKDKVDKKTKGKRKTKKDRALEFENPPEPIFPKLHPFVAFNALRYQANYKPAELVRAFKILAAVDERVKRSAGDPLILLEQAITGICGRQRTFLD